MGRVLKHGTYYGYKTHRKLREEPCVECRAANADYMQRFRAEVEVPIEERLDQTVIQWRKNKWGVSYPTVVYDPLPDGPVTAREA